MESDIFANKHQGSIIHYYRKKQKWSRLKLAQGLGVDESTIYRLEQRRSIRDLHKRLMLIALLGIPSSLLEVSEEVPSLPKPSLVFNDDRMTSFEDQLTMHWDIYRTGGTSYAAQGLNSFLNEIEHFIQEVKETPWRERADAVLCSTYQLQGCVFSDRTCYEQAHNTYKKAILLAQEADDSELFASVLARQGVTFLQQDHLTEAISCLEAALKMIHGRGFSSLRGYILKALSEGYARLHQASQSVHAIEQAERILEYTNDTFERSHCYINKASILAQKGINAGLLQDHDRSIMLIDKSLVNYNPTIVRGRARLLAQKAQAYYALNDLWACTTMAEEAYKMADAVGSVKTLERLRNLHQALLQSRWGKEASIIRLGILLAK